MSFIYLLSRFNVIIKQLSNRQLPLHRLLAGCGQSAGPSRSPTKEQYVEGPPLICLFNSLLLFHVMDNIRS